MSIRFTTNSTGMKFDDNGRHISVFHGQAQSWTRPFHAIFRCFCLTSTNFASASTRSKFQFHGTELIAIDAGCHDCITVELEGTNIPAQEWFFKLHINTAEQDRNKASAKALLLAPQMKDIAPCPHQAGTIESAENLSGRFLRA